MKAIRLEKHGGPEVLEYRDFDLPPPGTDQVRVRHTAIGVNFIEIYQRSGLFFNILIPKVGSSIFFKSSKTEELFCFMNSFKIAL